MRKNVIKKTLAAVTACITAVASVFVMPSYASEASGGKISLTATATNKDKEAQKGLEFSLYQIAVEDDGNFGYKVDAAAKKAGVSAEDLAGNKEATEIAKTLDAYYSTSDIKADQKVETNDTGKAEFTGLSNGVYLIRHTTSEDTFKTLGHRYTTDAFLVEITNVNKEIVCQPKGIVKDIPAEGNNSGGSTASTGAVAIIKVDEETGAYLAGAKFTLYKASGEKVGSCTTNDKGWADIKPLEYGDYYFVEDEAPEGYVKRTDKISFTLDQEHSYSADYPWNIKVTNKKAETASLWTNNTTPSGTGVGNNASSTDVGNGTVIGGSGVGGLISTGDYSNLALLCVIGGSSLILACAMATKRKKKNR